MSKRLWLTVVALLLQSPIFLLTASQSAGLSKLNTKGAAAIDEMFEAAIASQEIPGVVAAVVNKSELLYLKALGKQDVGKNIPMAKDTVGPPE